MGAWRFRRCPACKEVSAAGSFRPVSFGTFWNRKGSARRICPKCGFTAETSTFPIVREKHVKEVA